MNAAQIVELLAKGVGVISALAAAGQSIAPAAAAIKNLMGHAEAGTVTDDILEQTEADLDALIDRFNAPIADRP